MLLTSKMGVISQGLLLLKKKITDTFLWANVMFRLPASLLFLQSIKLDLLLRNYSSTLVHVVGMGPNPPYSGLGRWSRNNQLDYFISLRLAQGWVYVKTRTVRLILGLLLKLLGCLSLLEIHSVWLVATLPPVAITVSEWSQHKGMQSYRTQTANCIIWLLGSSWNKYSIPKLCQNTICVCVLHLN